MGDFNQNVPSLATMTRGALNVLDNDEEGFFLMVEGGAVDWAWTVGGAGYRGRAIEEQIDFNRSVEAVVDWVEQFSSWEETLLIVTSDHETGYVVGPNSWQEEVIEFHPIFGTPIVVAEGTTMEPVKNNGQGNLPDLEVLTGNHTSMLVPLWAIGAGSEMFDDPSLRIGYDAYAADFWSADGHYIDNTGIFTVMSESLVIPEPSLLRLIVLGIPLLLRRAVNR
jgi:alkaline phosphatase